MDHFRYIIVASDGLWGYATNLQVSRLVHVLRKEGRDSLRIAKEIVQLAIDQGSMDNITVFVMIMEYGEEGVEIEEEYDDLVIYDKYSQKKENEE